MAFVKVQKTKSYFKRFQTKYRRRREGKTDYYARKRMVIQDKDKYNSPKYRMVVRITGAKIIAQIMYATLVGDKVLCQANSTELSKWGLTAGLTNYASAYCTGLLLARRLLKQLKMDSFYAGKTAFDGEDYNVGEEPNAERRPFKAILDVGLVNTTTGNKVFGCMKGACDGGLYVPHSSNKFPGNTVDGEKKVSYDATVHRDRIFGVHVDQYMDALKEDGEEEYQGQFSQWDACLKKTKCDSVEALYKKVHAGILSEPTFTKKSSKANPDRAHTKYRTARSGRIARKTRANEKIKIALANQ